MVEVVDVVGPGSSCKSDPMINGLKGAAAVSAYAVGLSSTLGASLIKEPPTRCTFARHGWAADMVPDLVTVAGFTGYNVIAPDRGIGLAQAGGHGAFSDAGR